VGYMTALRSYLEWTVASIETVVPRHVQNAIDGLVAGSPSFVSFASTETSTHN
jgi:hypothetical protein